MSVGVGSLGAGVVSWRTKVPTTASCPHNPPGPCPSLLVCITGGFQDHREVWGKDHGLGAGWLCVHGGWKE